MKNRTMTLAMVVAGFGLQVAAPAQTISVAGPVSFGGVIGNVNNTYLTGQSPVTTAFIMGSGVTVNSGNITEVATATYATEATIRMENSAYPGIFYATDLTATTSFVGTFVCVPGTVRPWTTNGGNGGTIPVGSTWNLEFYETLDDSGAVPDSTGTDISFTINPPPTPPSHTDLGTVTPGNPLMDTISFLGANEVRWYKITVGAPVAAVNDEWLSIWTGESTVDTEVGIYLPSGTLLNSDDDSGAGDLSAFLYGTMLGDPNAGYEIATADAATLNAGVYYLAVGGFDTVFGADFGATSTYAGGGPVTLHVTRGVVTYPVNVSLPGPFEAGGPPGDAGNTTFAITTFASDFIYPKNMVFTGTGTENIVASNLNETRLRIRSSAYPGISTDYWLTSSTATSVTIGSVTIVSPEETSAGWTEAGSNSLKGLTMPAGSSLTGEFFDYFDNGAGADSTWTNVAIKMSEGAAIPAATPPSAVDLGVITDASVVTPVTALTGAHTAAEVKWYKITLPSNVNLANGRFLNIWTSLPPITTGALTDSVIAIYDANGKYISNNDQGANLAQAAMSFGSSGYTAPWVAASGDPDFNGHSGEGLAAGDYYIAVTGWTSGSLRNDGFVNAGGGGAFAGGTQLNIVSNAPAGQTLSGTLVLNNTVGTFYYTSDIAYEVKQGVTTLGSGTITAGTSSMSFTMDAGSGTGAAHVILTGGPFLREVYDVNLTGSNQNVGTFTMRNGNVVSDVEVGPTDIDAVIAAFGEQSGVNANCDRDAEVGPVDIDVVVANFGEQIDELP